MKRFLVRHITPAHSEKIRMFRQRELSYREIAARMLELHDAAFSVHQIRRECERFGVVRRLG